MSGDSQSAKDACTLLKPVGPFAGWHTKKLQDQLTSAEKRRELSQLIGEHSFGAKFYQGEWTYRKRPVFTRVWIESLDILVRHRKPTHAAQQLRAGPGARTPGRLPDLCPAHAPRLPRRKIAGARRSASTSSSRACGGMRPWSVPTRSCGATKTRSTACGTPSLI